MKGLVLIVILLVSFLICVLLYSTISSKDRTNEIHENLEKLSKVKTIQECDPLAEKTDRIPNCDGQICIDSGSNYGSLMASCIAGFGARNNEENVCVDSERNKNICKKIIKIYPEVSKMPVPNMDIDKCSNNIEKECELEYLKKATPETQVNIECSSYEDLDDRDACFFELAIRNNDYSLCSTIDEGRGFVNKLDQAKCYYLLAIRNNNEKICEMIENKSSAEECKKALGLFKNNDVGVCNNISLDYYGSASKKACLMFFAIYKHDLTMCDGKEIYDTELCKKVVRLPMK